MFNNKPEGISRKLLNILVCPITKTPLSYDKKNQQLISKAAGLSFPIYDGIPVMLADQATPIKK